MTIPARSFFQPLAEVAATDLTPMPLAEAEAEAAGLVALEVVQRVPQAQMAVTLITMPPPQETLLVVGVREAQTLVALMDLTLNMAAVAVEALY